MKLINHGLWADDSASPKPLSAAMLIDDLGKLRQKYSKLLESSDPVILFHWRKILDELDVLL